MPLAVFAASTRGLRAVEEVLPAATLRETAKIQRIAPCTACHTCCAEAGQMQADAPIIRKAMRDLCQVPAPVAITELYHSLNPRHAALATHVEVALWEMAQQGELKRIWTQAAHRTHKALLTAP